MSQYIEEGDSSQYNEYVEGNVEGYYENVEETKNDYYENVEEEGKNDYYEESKTTNEQEWTKYDDGQGNIFYYNNYTGESVWDKPDNYISPQGGEEHQEYNKEPEVVEEAPIIVKSDEDIGKEIDHTLNEYIERYKDEIFHYHAKDAYSIMHEAYTEGPHRVAALMFLNINADIQRWGCWTVMKISMDKKKLKLLLEVGCIAAVLRAMMIYSDSSSIVSQAMIAISCVSEIDETRSYLMDLNILKLICTAMRRVETLVVDKDEGEKNNGVAIAIHGLHTLSLFYIDERIRTSAVAFGMHEAILMMRVLSADGVVVEAAAHALRHFCHDDTYLRDYASNAGVIDLLEHFYTSYIKDDAVRRALKLCLAELEGGVLVPETPRDHSSYSIHESPRAKKARMEQEYLSITKFEEIKAVEEYKQEVLNLKKKMYSRFSYITPEAAAKMGISDPKNTMEATKLASERREANVKSMSKLREKKEKYDIYKHEYMANKNEKDEHDRAKKLMADTVKKHTNKGVLKKDIDKLFQENNFDARRFEQVFDELEIEGLIYAGGYGLIYWDGPESEDDDED